MNSNDFIVNVIHNRYSEAQIRLGDMASYLKKRFMYNCTIPFS